MTLTTQFSLNCKWRSCKRNQNAVFTRSLSPVLLITTPTLTPSLLKPALTVTITGSPSSVCELMYQSIPAAPPPPTPSYCGAFAHLISPKGGALAILHSPGVWHLPIPGPPLTFWHARGTFYPDLSQSCTQSLLAFWSAGEHPWENGNLHYQKTWESGLSAHASVQNGSESN